MPNWTTALAGGDTCIDEERLEKVRERNGIYNSVTIQRKEYPMRTEGQSGAARQQAEMCDFT
jgi:hypothetical protein